MTLSPTSRTAPERTLRRLELTITRRLDGLLHGNHTGLVPGLGSESAESREYRPGEDDVRRMDWAVTARTTVPHVRDLVADRELETTAVVDATASMDFGTAEMEKRDLAVAAVAAIGFLTQRAGNRLAAVIAGEQGLRRFPPQTGREPLLRVLRDLVNTPRAAPAADRDRPALADILRAADRQLRRRGLVVVVSDFLDPDVDTWSQGLRRLASRHQVLAVEVLDPRELELPNVGLLAVVDPETGTRRDVWTGSRRLRARYAAAAVEQRLTVRAAVRSAGAGHLQLRTDRDWLRDIARHVITQRRLARTPVRPGSYRPSPAGPTTRGSGGSA